MSESVSESVSVASKEERWAPLLQAWRSPWRHSIAQAVYVKGTGAHTGEQVEVTIEPRTAQDVHTSGSGVLINGAPLSMWRRSNAHFATTLSYQGQTLSTPEHLLGALYLAGVDDVCVEVSGAEVPILDGSALPWLERLTPLPLVGEEGPVARVFHTLPSRSLTLDACTLTTQPTPLPEAQGPLSARLSLSLSQLYPELANPALPAHVLTHLNAPQRALCLGGVEMYELIASARTFGLLAHEGPLRAQGLIQGVSVENTIPLNERGEPITPLRHPHELAAHKLLDALGDLSLSSVRWRGHLEVTRGSHALNHLLLKALSQTLSR